MAYLEKVGQQSSEDIRRDRRPRDDKAGGTVIRPPETWEEAHAVLVEIEGLKAGSRALDARIRGGGLTVGAQGAGKGLCWSWRDYGKRDREGYDFDHPLEMKGVSKKRKGS